MVRRLDLTDVAQVKQLLLDAEGVPTDSYLVDAFDKALQYEVESQAPIIDAAISLNSLDSASYPPPYLDGSKELQELVNCALFQNPERLRLAGSEQSRVAFGDLLWLRERHRQEDERADEQGPLAAIGPDQILAVLSPACDLQRQGALRILLLVGEVRPLGPSEWTYKDEPTRTPVMRPATGEYFWIKWDLKHIETVSHQELDRLLEGPHGFVLVARLRELHALELQQKLLSTLGRVGLMASIPATFPVTVEVYLPDNEKRPRALNLPLPGVAGGNRFVGRSGEKDMRLVLTEAACDAICQAIQDVDLNVVHPNARPAVQYLRESGELQLALERGIVLPSLTAQGWKEIPSPSGATIGEGSHAKVRPIGLVGTKACLDRQLPNAEMPKAGILICVGDGDPNM
jgi:hypothetical protein